MAQAHVSHSHKTHTQKHIYKHKHYMLTYKVTRRQCVTESQLFFYNVDFIKINYQIASDKIKHPSCS